MGFQVGDKIVSGETPPRREAYIYGLCDPRTARLRYIGMTLNPVERLREHLSDRAGSAKERWIASLKDRGQQPYMVILEICAYSVASNREKWHIRRYKGLLNGQRGKFQAPAVGLTVARRRILRRMQQIGLRLSELKSLARKQDANRIQALESRLKELQSALNGCDILGSLDD